MSEDQANFIRSLAGERDLSSLAPDRARRLSRILAGEIDPEGGRGGEASRLIDLLKSLPMLPAEDIAVPAGRYAVALGGNNAVEFFQVDRPTEGKWAGYCFVKQQASDDTYPVRGSRKGQVLDAIALDPEAALLRYGQELGRCGNCGRTLTDDVSREMGIGPDCAANLGIARPAKPTQAREALDPANDVGRVPHHMNATEAAAFITEVAGPRVGQLQDLPGTTWEDIFR